MHQVGARTTHKVPLVRTLELEDIRSPARGLCHLFKGCIAREEDQVIAGIARRAFFPHEVQETIVIVGEHDCTFSRVRVNKVGPGASKGPSGFEGEEGLAVCEDDRHDRCQLVDDTDNGHDAYVRRSFKRPVRFGNRLDLAIR